MCLPVSHYVRQFGGMNGGTAKIHWGSPILPLTDRSIQAFKPTAKPYKRGDRHGLYIEVFQNGSKLWRLKYRYGGREKRLALGSYPEVSLAEARKRRDINRSRLHEGFDPSLDRRKARAAAKVSADNAFAKVAEEYLDKMRKEGRAESTVRKAMWFLDLLRPSIGMIPVDQIDTQTLLAALKKLEHRGVLETARKVRSFASRVFRLAIFSGRAQFDPAQMLSGALLAPQTTHFAAILEPELLGRLLRKVENYRGAISTRFALRIAPHVFLRPGELRLAKWTEIDFDQKTWRIPAERMKTRRPHIIPLSQQVLENLKSLHELTGPYGYVFPAFHAPRRPMSENTVNQAFRRMEFGKDVITGHGLRATASTLLNESGKFNPDAIERALSHKDADAVRGAYHRGTYWAERVRMAQWWSDYLDEIRDSKDLQQAASDLATSGVVADVQHESELIAA